MTRLPHRALLAALLVCAVAPSTRAQPARRDVLRVLRFLPSGPISPTDSLVVAFDHPVAPALDRSVDPAGVVRLDPAVRTTAYWRDPSTIVVRFSEPLPFGTHYRVTFQPKLRAAEGAALAEGQGRELRVRQPRLLLVSPSGGRQNPDAVQRPFAVYEGDVSLGALVGRLVTLSRGSCVEGTVIPLRADSIRPILTTDPDEIRRPGRGWDSRLDVQRRVVRFSAAMPIPEGCGVTAHVSREPGGVVSEAGQFFVPARFAVRHIGCVNAPCENGNLTISFSHPVLGSEVERHVRVDGARASVGPFGVSRDASSDSWRLQQIVLPGREVQVAIDGSLVDVLGRALGADVRRTVRGRHLPPTVEFIAGPVIVPRDADMLFALRHTNTDSITVAIGRVADSLRPALIRARHFEYPEVPPRMEPDSVVRVVATRAPEDSAVTFVVPLSWIPRAWRDEPLLLFRAWPSRPPRRVEIGHWAPYAVVHRTSLAAHVLHGQGTIDVLVTSLRDAAPVAGARVRFLDGGRRELATGATDEHGRSRLRYVAPTTASWEREALVEVSARGERLLLALNVYGGRSMAAEEDAEEDAARALWYYRRRSGGDLPDGRALHGVAFADRGIYRPGERVHVKGIVRTSRPDADFATPAGDSVRWTLSRQNPDFTRDRIARTTAVLSSFGTSDATFEFPRTAALGGYVATLSFRTGGSWRIATETTLRIAEYRPVEFEVALNADTSVALFAGDTARLRARARYLFGMPMDGGALQWNAQIVDRDYWSAVPRPKSLDGFEVGRSWWRLRGAASRNYPDGTSGTVKLGAKGTAAIVAPVGAVSTTSTLVVIASVTDANRQTVTAQRQLTVHASDAYVGIRVRPWRWVRAVGDSVPLELLAVRANGALRPGTPIALRAVRYEWRGNDWRADTVWRSSALSADSVVRATFVPSTTGWFEVLASATDERGRTATSGYDLWVSGTSLAATRSSGEVSFTLDRQSYAPGDTAVAVIESAGERRAWITLSASTPLFERQVVLQRGANIVRIPIPSSAMSTARVGVIALRPVARGRDAVATHFTNTEQWITVAHSSRALDVRVSPDRTRYVPGDSVTLHVRVRDNAGQGRRSEVTVWAVDQGVAALTGLEKPDLLPPLLAAADRVSVVSTLTIPLVTSPIGIWLGRSVQVRIRGATSGVQLEQVVTTGYGFMDSARAPRRMAANGEAAMLRSVFATTPFWNASVVTDSAGEATTRFVLPHNVTTFRLFSAAITSGTEAGGGDTSIVTTRPLLVRAALPRVVRQGDTLLAGGVITQDTTTRTVARLAVDATGIDVTGPRVREDTLVGRRASELRFPMRVTSADSVTVTLRTDGGGHADAVRTTLPVSPPGHARAHVVMGTLEGKADVALPVVDGADRDRSTVTLQLGVSPLGIVRQLDRTLRIYPYYCTEQLTSAARALLGRRALERALDGESEMSSADRAQLERGIAILVSRQRADGAIGYWHATDWSSPWLTAYALEMMLDARDAGIAVPAGSLDRAANYLQRGHAERSSELWVNARDRSPHDLVAAVRALHRAGLSDSLLDAALSTRASRLGFVDRLNYAMLIAGRGDSTAARAIVRDAWRATRVEGRLVRLADSTDGDGWLFRSSVRPAARLFAATAALEPRHPQLGALFESIVQRGRGDSRFAWNTIEQAELADAIVGARAIFGFGDPRAVTVRAQSGATIATSRFASGRTDSASFTLAAVGASREDMPARLSLEADSPAPIYYAATLLETPRTRPVRADDEGIGVERWYESYTTGKPLTSVRAGELVRVRLRVMIPSEREFVAITDPLPAGLEAVDLSLRTSSTLAPFQGAPRRGDRDGDAAPGGMWSHGSWDGGWWTPWDHKEIRDDRVHWFARRLWKGTFEISYVARATTAGNFVRPPAYAEEMYNPAVRGRSDGGWFEVKAQQAVRDSNAGRQRDAADRVDRR